MKKDTKYGKYFVETEGPTATGPVGETPRLVSKLNDEIMKGSNFYAAVWFGPEVVKKFNYEMSGHPPHIHRYAEILIHMGTDPDNPRDLGCDVEIYMGKELERHVFSEPTVVYIPPNFIHCPWRPMNMRKPFMFIQIDQGPDHTEKFYPQILPREVREKIDWSRWKDKGDYFSLPLNAP